MLFYNDKAPVQLLAYQLPLVFPRLPENDREARLAAVNESLELIQATSVKRAAAFLGQIAHESGDLRWLREIWQPDRVDEQETYERNQAAAWPPTSQDDRNRKAYLLGNFAAGDGKNFRGWGPLQITGRGNTKAASKWIFGDDRLTLAPNSLNTLEVGFKGACWFWCDGVRERLSGRAKKVLSLAGYNLETFSCNDAADKDDIEALTLSINGGLNGHAGRVVAIDRARRALVG